MNFKGTKKLYIIKTCEQILYFNSIKHHIQFQYNCIGWVLGLRHYPKKSVWVGPAVCFLPCQILTKLCDFHYPISGLIQYSIPNFKPGLSLQSQNMIREATQENVFGLCVTQSVLHKGHLLKHTVYIQCVYHSTFDCS